jgi:hypothetical protein
MCGGVKDISVALGISTDQSAALVFHMCENNHISKGSDGHRISKCWFTKQRYYSLTY